MRPILVLSAFLCLGLAFLGPPDDVARVRAARAFLAGLDEDGRAAASFPFDSEERTTWNFLPGDYPGLRLSELEDPRMESLREFLMTHLSMKGAVKARMVFLLEEVLHAIESRAGRPADHRDPGRYYLAFFGEPGDGPWGWRLQGHHLSLHFTSVPGRLTAHTPLFYGAAPKRATAEEHPVVAPWGGPVEVLGAEERAARALLAAFEGEAREKVVVSDASPREILLAPGRGAQFEQRVGVAGRDMTPEQRALLGGLLEVFFQDLAHDLAEAQRERMTGGDALDDVTFAWQGSTEPDGVCYFRLHGPDWAIEYATVANDPDHVHCVWRGPGSDFGADILREHYANEHGDDEDDR